jgi:hypothetical protein
VLDKGAVSFIVLDTVNGAGFAGGSIDETQFIWLQNRLIERTSTYFDANNQQVATASADKLVVVVSHHPTDAINNPFPGPNAQERRYQGPELEALLHRFPNVALHLAGHTLENRITPRPFAADPSRGYWEITTGGPLDMPMQARLIEIVDNVDGTISVFSTVYDNAAPLNPGDADDPTPDDGVNQLLLAGVARQIAARDPQRLADAGGLAPADRNAELVLTAASPSTATATASGSPTPVADTPAPSGSPAPSAS